MTTGRLVAIGAAGVALFLVASILVVDWLTSEPSSTRAGAGAPAETAVDARQLALGDAVFRASHPGAGQADVNLQSVYQVDQGPPPPAQGTWEAVRIAPRPASLGKVGVALGQGLNELHPALSACAEEDAQSRHGTSAISAVQDSQPADDAGVPVLVLQLETMTDAIRIVDAPVETRGGASDGLLACAQSKLRGRVVEAPGTVAGQRYRLLYTLLP